ncbi:MAG: ThiF family adenylyltransferase, partial [Gammaproteobacteria bacterium]
LTDSPCYRCLYPNLPQEAESCLDSGILGSVTGLVGMILATECVKLLCSIDDTLSNKLMLVDLKKNEFRTIKLSKDEKCKFCK